MDELKNRQLDGALPAQSELRSYLRAKPETSRRAARAQSPMPTRFRRAIDCNQPVALVLPPACFSPGAIKRLVPPLGLHFIAASLASAGLKSFVFDCVLSGVHDERALNNGLIAVGLRARGAAAEILSRNPCAVCVSILYSSDLEAALELLREIRLAGFSGPTIIGGLHPSIYPQEALMPAAPGSPLPDVDFVVRGEGEIRLLKLLTALAQGHFDRNQDGLCGFIGGAPFVNDQIAMIEDLDAIAFPLYEAADLERYFAINLPFSPFPKGKRVAQILTSRGCPVGCTFCASTNYNRRYRARSVENVIAEIKGLQARHGVDEIQFADDNLTFDRARARKLFEALQPLATHWCTPNGIMINTLDEALAESMAASGMYQITLSFDAGTESSLRQRHRKPVNLEHGLRLAQMLNAMGVLIHTTLVIGMPGETEEEIKRAFDFFLELPAHSVGLFFAQALPGSELYETLLAEGALDGATARAIDTARPMPGVSQIEASRLTALASDFLEAFNTNAKRRFPKLWEQKYVAHVSRLKPWIVGGSANANFAHVEVAHGA